MATIPLMMQASVRPVQLEPQSLLALHAANPQRYPVLLESAAAGERVGRFDILMAFPGERLTLNPDGSLQGDSAAQSGRFLDALDQRWQTGRQAMPSGSAPLGLPFTGGWFLFLSYELAGQVEPRLHLPRAAAQPVAQAVRIPAAIVRRVDSGQAWIVAEAGAGSLTDEILTDLQHLPSGSSPSIAIIEGAIDEEDPQRYIDAVRAALEHITAGDVYQANLSRGWRARLASGIRPMDVYRRLRVANAAPFAALAVLGDDYAVVSSSPERLIEIRGGRVSTRPIAGTRPRSRDEQIDRGLARELHGHPKERAEHVMLLDLERNDLGRICVGGSVEVDEYMTIESYTHVHHIVSNVRGRLRPGVTPGQAIAAVFPGGTITGCPKVRCMEIIAALEQVPRGAYTGSMGYLNHDGSMDLNILIRTLELRPGEVSFRAGAGIVADSDPQREVEETRAKARGMINALSGGERKP